MVANHPITIHYMISQYNFQVGIVTLYQVQTEMTMKPWKCCCYFLKTVKKTYNTDFKHANEKRYYKRISIEQKALY